MALLHFRCKERRRTVRVNLTVPLLVHVEAEEGEKTSVKATAVSVNRHGALIQMDHTVTVGQRVLIVNENNKCTIESRVTSIKRDRNGKQAVGMEFLSPDLNFWQMTFPVPGARPIRRPIPSKATA